MNEVRFNEMLDRVISRVLSEQAQLTLSKLYVIIPENWDASENIEMVEFYKKLQEKYNICFVVCSDKYDYFKMNFKNATTVKQCEACSPEKGSKTFFSNIDTKFLAKVSLLLCDDFYSSWAEKCLQNNNKIYVRADRPFYNKLSAQEYIRKVDSYIRDLKSFGVNFAWKNLIKESKKEIKKDLSVFKDKKNSGISSKKNVITTKNIQNLGNTKKIYLGKNDIITMLAKERAEELGISIIRE